MSLPTTVQVLIVGAGPTGLAAAVTLAKHGLHVAIVDSSPSNQYGSRAAIVHSRTLEVLDTVGLAQPLIEYGTRCDNVQFRGTTDALLQFDLSQLKDLTEFPFAVLIAQHDVERIFREQLAAQGIQILRNKAVVGLREVDGDACMEVTFEDGSTTRTRYVIGADGARSTIRRLIGIEFKDPRSGIAYDAPTAPSFHLVLADAYLEPPIPESISWDRPCISLDKFFILLPLPSNDDSSSSPSLFCRIVYAIPVGDSRPPQNPSHEYLQQLMDDRNPWGSRIKIASVTTASRYKVRTAVASSYFRKLGDGNVLLAGDAAHVHSPAGGQGMNLGICDAVAVAEAINAHVEAKDSEKGDAVLQRYADSRKKIGVRVIGLARGMTILVNAGTGWRKIIRNLAFRIFSYLPFLNKVVVWRLSGLVNRDG